MRNLVTGQKMKAIDQYTIEEIGIPSLVLQERAAWCVACEVKKRIKKETPVWAVCGTGNNGADAVAAARILWEEGYQAAIILAGDRAKETSECTVQRKIAENLEIPMLSWKEAEEGFSGAVIDGLFGVGLTRNIEGEYRDCMEMVKRQPVSITVAVDIPSGVDSDTGSIMGIALKADVTVTFGWEKCGTVLFPGRDFAGRVVIGKIGFSDLSCQKASGKKIWEEKKSFAYDISDLKRLPERPAYSNKGTFGRVLVAAGSKNMSGAAYFAARAAYRCGAGLVKILTVEDNREILQQQLPEAIVASYSPEMIREDTERFGRLLEKECVWADAVVLGPGIGTEPYARELVAGVLSFACSTIIVDADALNIISRNPEITRYYTENVIITPHLGEMARLTGKSIQEIQQDVPGTAAEYSAKWGITCVLKDGASVVTDKDGARYLNTSGNNVLAKAGSGDVLTGIIGAFCARGMEPFEGASLGVYVHGIAGDMYKNKKGNASLLAGELADMAGEAVDKGYLRQEKRYDESGETEHFL